MVDFGALPPEINSTRMYAGPGPLSLSAAATAWDNLAAELHFVASSYRTVIAGLTTGRWMGPSSLSMASAFGPYVAWTTGAAARAAEAAGQARLAVEAYEAAFAMTVPPPVVFANRAQLATLTATNYFGQNSPAIAANEAQYGEMWAQDAAAMYQYAANSAIATDVTPFTDAPQVTDTNGLTSQEVAVAKATGLSAGDQAAMQSLVQTVPSTLDAMSTPVSFASTSLLGDTASGLAGLGLDPTTVSTLSNVAAIWIMAVPTPLYALSSLFGIAQSSQAMGMATVPIGADAAAAGVGAAEAATAGAAGLGNAGVLGTMGSAASLGPLSIPQGWTSVIPPAPVGGAVTALPGAAAGASSMPSMLGGVPLRAPGSGAGPTPGPRYGLVPTVMAQPPSAGYG
ncbi:PPE family protein [Mycobacterium lentiflavum]|uniref:PPE family protein n=1 Tax=Mycobacterium lentiflavum TaxID=141349 RepID=A0A0E4H3L7_MYCLN|nr:PPE family protein [Mycobacterium lentiflavum]MEE3065416.1 PPE family protein [Actinomycetota bacterium]ULP45266.2 PPE family protein [Mycobacterium lentiflavum]CQD20065.1 PPE family protein [Mycobacterium lentiflavum]